eukprot:3722542-Amphidinium_carterae.2
MEVMSMNTSLCLETQQSRPPPLLTNTSKMYKLLEVLWHTGCCIGHAGMILMYSGPDSGDAKVSMGARKSV